MERNRYDHVVIPDLRADIIRVPDRGASWNREIQAFALSYDAYFRFGPIHELGPFANATIERWRRYGSLPMTLHALRSCLFFEQRRWRLIAQGPVFKGIESPTEPEGEDRAYIEALLERIRALSGGCLRGPADPPPL